MLRYDERDASFAQALGILGHHVVAHDLYVAAICLQQEVAHDVRLRTQRDAVVDARMLIEERLEFLRVMLARIAQRQFQVGDYHVRVVVGHVVAEAHFAVRLLLAGDFAILGNLHEHDLLFGRGYHHKRLGSEVAAGKGVLPIERERLQVGHVRVE